MRLGASLPPTAAEGGPPRAGSLIEDARRLEAHAFDSVWVFDAMGRGFLIPDPLIAVSVVAAVTERVEVGTGVLQVPLRRPVELAHRILTAHAVCGGRLLLGVGAGSTRDDFDAVGVDYDRRHQFFAEALPVIRDLLRSGRAGDVDLTPWPDLADGPPVLIGSWGGQRAVEEAASQYDGWVASAAKTSLTRLGDAIARYRAAGGQRAVVTNIGVDLTAPSSPLDPDGPFTLHCPPEQASARLGMLADLGFDDAVLLHARPTDENLEAMRALLPVAGAARSTVAP